MHIDTALHRYLLGTFLLAAGCGVEYGEFKSEENFLQCELRVACGEQSQECSMELWPSEMSDCERFHRVKANRCLNKLEDYLVEVEDDPGLCADHPWYDIEACNDAVTTRQTDECTIVTGRPLLHEGQALLPTIVAGDAWAEQCLEISADAGMARVAAERWLEIARTEHASVAAFSRASLELMAVGAPPELLEGCHQAALDEIRHARLALDIARALGDESWDLGPIPAVPSRVATLRTIAIDALLEGCIGEGGAAASAHLAAERTEGAVAQGLRVIAEDETRHAALAWSTLRWALGEDPSLAGPLREALALARAERREQLAARPEERSPLAELGVVSASEAVRVELDVIERIVAPVLEQLTHEVQAPVLRA